MSLSIFNCLSFSYISSISPYFTMDWDRLFGRVIVQGLTYVLPALLAYLFLTYKSIHPIQKSNHRHFRLGKDYLISPGDDYADHQMASRKSEKKSRIWHLMLLLVFLPSLLATAGYFIKGYVSDNKDWDWGILFSLFFLLFLAPILVRKHYTRDLLGRISTRPADYLLKTRIPFSFFLRAFQTDDYSSSDNSDGAFSERVFAGYLARRSIRWFSLGNPSEIDSPKGSHRVYSVKNWEEDVEKIIHRAKHIYFRVSSSENCMKEFKMLLGVLDKTTLIVDSAGWSDYEILREDFPSLPELEPIQGNFIYFVQKKGEDLKALRMYKSGNTYRQSPPREHLRAESEGIDYSDEVDSYKDKCLRVFVGIIIACLFCFIMSGSKEKQGKRMWVKQNVLECPIVVDSMLIIQDCNLDTHHLRIQLSSSGISVDDINEYLALKCFCHLNEYDWDKLGACLKLLGGYPITLEFIDNDGKRNRQFEFLASEWKRLDVDYANICRQEKERRKAEENSQSSPKQVKKEGLRLFPEIKIH